jgi:cell division protease FtsH
VVTRGELLDDLCVLLGGREAEQLLLGDLSIGCAGDLRRATDIARALVEEFGMGTSEVGLAQCPTEQSEGSRSRQYSPEQLGAIDRGVRDILREAQQRAATILRDNRALIETLRDLLVAHKVIDSATLSTIRAREAAG